MRGMKLQSVWERTVSIIFISIIFKNIIYVYLFDF